MGMHLQCKPAAKWLGSHNTMTQGVTLYYSWLLQIDGGVNFQGSAFETWHLYLISPTKATVSCARSYRHQLHLLWRLFQLGPIRDMVVSLAFWSLIPHLGINDFLDWPHQYMADQWQRSHSEEAWVGDIFLLPWGLHILMGRLWTQLYHKMPCLMGQIQWTAVHPDPPLISHHL